MKRLNRKVFISNASELLERKGYHGTSMNDILSACNAQKGSLYHFFPAGKEELAAEAIEHQGKHLAELTRTMLAKNEDSAMAVYQFILGMAERAEQSAYNVGAPFAAIAQELATTNERLRQACMNAYQSLQNAVQEKLEADGFTHEKAEELAVTIISAIDGAILLTRTRQSSLPLRHTAHSMRRLIKKAK